jgi:hypothetical protein
MSQNPPPLHFSSDGSAIELRILDYQFPDNLRGQYDADWLRVEGVVTHPNGNWRFCDPCLLTWEALALAKWFECWDDSAKAHTSIGFIEPNLSFSRIDSFRGSVLRISFELESRPPWAGKGVVGESDIWLEFPLNLSAARIAAQIMRNQLKPFPVRVGP